MFRLGLLGGLTLEIEHGALQGRATQKRRLALLAVLVTRPGVAITRDKLLALFWPETPTEEGRHRLSAALYDLRRALGDDVLLTRGDEVLIATGAVRCDVVDFEAALHERDWQGAAQLYRGPFLDGVHIESAPGFEDWADQRRTDLARLYSRCLEEWATACEQRGDLAGAAEVWQRLADAEPLSDRIALRLMRALEAAGNRAAALRHASLHEARLRHELGVQPDASVRDFTAAVRAAHLARRESTDAPAADAAVVPSSVAEADIAASSRVGVARVPRRSRMLRAAMLMLLLAVPAALGILPTQRGPRSDAVARDAAPARRAFAEGEAHLQAGRFDAAVAAFERAVENDSTFPLAHFQLAVATLWADQPGEKIDGRLARALAHRNELDALNRTLLEGFEAWRRGNWNQAEALYRRALVLEPGSVQARHELGEVLFHYNAPQGRSIDEARPEFERVLQREPKHYGALWHLAQLAARDRRVGDVEHLASRLLELHPDAVRRLEVRALRAAAMDHNAELEQILDQLRGADESFLFGVGWRLAVFGRDLDAAQRAFALLTDSARGPYARALGHTQLLFIESAHADSVAVAKRLLELAQLRAAWVPVEHLMLLSMIGAGVQPDTKKLRQVRASLETMLASETVEQNTTQARVAGAVITLGWTYALLGDSTAALAIARQFERAGNAGGGNADRDVGRAATIRALVARQAGDHAGVIRWTGSSLVHRWFGEALVSPVSAYSVERYIRAEALLALGKNDEADAWFASIGQHDPTDLALLPAALMQRARIADARRDRAAVKKLTAQLEALRPQGAGYVRSAASANRKHRVTEDSEFSPR